MPRVSAVSRVGIVSNTPRRAIHTFDNPENQAKYIQYCDQRDKMIARTADLAWDHYLQELSTMHEYEPIAYEYNGKDILSRVDMDRIADLLRQKDKTVSVKHTSGSLVFERIPDGGSKSSGGCNLL
jgi:hypothetical protein